MAELFSNVEVNREPRWKLIAVLLGGSMALHVVLGAGVIFVPTVRDALNIVALAGKRGYVDKAYSRTVFGENIQIIQVEPKFQYPPGYFAPESVLAAALAAASPTPSSTPNPNPPKIISQAPFKPSVKPSPFPSPISTPSPAIAKATGSPAAKSGTTKDGKTGNQQAGEEKGPEKDKPDAAGDAKQQEAQKQLDAVAAANHFDLPTEINRKPLKDLVAETNDLMNQRKLDLDHEFDLRIEADLDEKGQLQNPTVTRKSGDQTLVDLSTRAIGVLNETGLVTYLKYLSEGKPIKVTFVVSQDQKNLNATVESEVNTEDVARQKVKTMNFALVLGKAAREGKDEATLMGSTIVTSEGKKVIVKFKMAHQDVAELLKKQLASSEAAKPD